MKIPNIIYAIFFMDLKYVLIIYINIKKNKYNNVSLVYSPVAQLVERVTVNH